MTKRTAVLLLIAGVIAIFTPVVLREIGAWFPAADFLFWAGVGMVGGSALIAASLSLEERR